MLIFILFCTLLIVRIKWWLPQTSHTDQRLEATSPSFSNFFSFELNSKWLNSPDYITMTVVYAYIWSKRWHSWEIRGWDKRQKRLFLSQLPFLFIAMSLAIIWHSRTVVSTELSSSTIPALWVPITPFPLLVPWVLGVAKTSHCCRSSCILLLICVSCK